MEEPPPEAGALPRPDLNLVVSGLRPLSMVKPPLKPRVIFVAKFLVALIGFYALVALNPVNDHVIVPFTEFIASSAAFVLRVLGQRVEAAGTLIQSPRFLMDVRNGCNGVEAMLLLVAAILAFPASFRSRLIGLTIASVAIQILNLFRVSCLVWLGEHHRGIFDFFHVTVWQSIVILAAMSMFVLWSWKFAEKPLAKPR